MTAKRGTIRFILNNEMVEISEVLPSDTLLDFLRLQKRLRGTKEGCAEGDCGACTVLVGRLRNDQLRYESVNACIRFVASLDGSHVVTIEHLKKPDGTLHPVQQAMVDFHGSQCGFCTPGIVMSLYALWMSKPNPDDHDIETSLQGNLCRCTGYEPIIRAAKGISDLGNLKNDRLMTEREVISKRLQALNDGSLVEIQCKGHHLIVPDSLDQFAEIRQANPDSTIVSGATDVGLWVTKEMRDISPAIFIDNLEELRQVEISDDGVMIGAGVTYTDFADIITQHFPQLTEYWNRIGGEQVRNMGTIGGNIANGSPIGDTPPPLIALGAKITMRCGSDRRILALEDFFIDYGKQERQSGDFLESIFIPFLHKDDHFAAYKISKRLDEDISAVTIACRLRLNGEVVEELVVACGGLAGVPKRAVSVEGLMTGKRWNRENIEIAVPKFQEDFSPLTDWRASAEYRATVTGNLFRRFFLESIGQQEGLRLEQRISG